MLSINLTNFNLYLHQTATTASPSCFPFKYFKQPEHCKENARGSETGKKENLVNGTRKGAYLSYFIMLESVLSGIYLVKKSDHNTEYTGTHLFDSAF